MGRVIVQEFVTLDGLAAGPDGTLDFIPAAVEGDTVLRDSQMWFIDTIGTIVLGRRTYELFAGYWPDVTGDDKPFGDKLNAIPKVVFSKTLERAPWGSWEEASVSHNDPRDEIQRLREVEDKDLVVWGSITLVRSLAEAGLVDEYHLWLLPVVLNHGTPLFADGAGTVALQLRDATTTHRGAVLLRYEPR